jgi:uncharacterized protein with PQ loop repeat
MVMFHAHHHLHKRKRQRLKNYPHPNKWITFLDKFILLIAVLGPVMNLPQVIKIYYFQTAAGVSALTFFLLCIMNIPWLIYGFVHKDKPIIISSVLWIISNIVVMAGAILYG